MVQSAMTQRLGINVDHVATVRQARKARYPDPVTAAALAELGGADQITLHLREDRRHIQERDLRILRETVQTSLNLEMAATAEMLKIAYEHKPDTVTLVPELYSILRPGVATSLLRRDEAEAHARPSGAEADAAG